MHAVSKQRSPQKLCFPIRWTAYSLFYSKSHGKKYTEESGLDQLEAGIYIEPTLQQIIGGKYNQPIQPLFSNVSYVLFRYRQNPEYREAVDHLKRMLDLEATGYMKENTDHLQGILDK